MNRTKGLAWATGLAACAAALAQPPEQEDRPRERRDDRRPRPERRIEREPRPEGDAEAHRPRRGPANDAPPPPNGPANQRPGAAGPPRGGFGAMGPQAGRPGVSGGVRFGFGGVGGAGPMPGQQPGGGGVQNPFGGPPGGSPFAAMFGGGPAAPRPRRVVSSFDIPEGFDANQLHVFGLDVKILNLPGRIIALGTEEDVAMLKEVISLVGNAGGRSPGPGGASRPRGGGASPPGRTPAPPRAESVSSNPPPGASPEDALAAKVRRLAGMQPEQREAQIAKEKPQFQRSLRKRVEELRQEGAQPAAPSARPFI